jgi:hypothetical protein
MVSGLRAREIGAGTKGRPGAREYGNPNARIRVEAQKSLRQLETGIEIERVSLVRPIQRHSADGIRDLDEHARHQ